MPIPIEKPTSPSLYSFFRGLKKVRISSGRENSSKNALLICPKYLISRTGDSRNQNRTKLTGSMAGFIVQV